MHLLRQVREALSHAQHRDEGRLPVFGKNCIGCTACSFNCPADAISIGVLNGWRVNGAYKFAPPREGLTRKDVCNYWRGSYIRYFREHGIELNKE